MTGFDVMAWDARQNARRRRAAMVRRGKVIDQRFNVADAINGNTGDIIRARVNERCGFDFCGIFAAGKEQAA